jgi:hypothetical protein
VGKCETCTQQKEAPVLSIAENDGKTAGRADRNENF